MGELSLHGASGARMYVPLQRRAWRTCTHSWQRASMIFAGKTVRAAVTHPTPTPPNCRAAHAGCLLTLHAWSGVACVCVCVCVIYFLLFPSPEYQDPSVRLPGPNARVQQLRGAS